MRTLCSVLVLASSVAQAAALGGVVDLNGPGELQALRERRPEHYARVEAVLALARAAPPARAGSLIEARLGASDVELLQWRVSDPPRLRVSFTLDDARYTAEVIPVLPPAHAIPAR